MYCDSYHSTKRRNKILIVKSGEPIPPDLDAGEWLIDRRSRQTQVKPEIEKEIMKRGFYLSESQAKIKESIGDQPK